LRVDQQFPFAQPPFQFGRSAPPGKSLLGFQPEFERLFIRRQPGVADDGSASRRAFNADWANQFISCIAVFLAPAKDNKHRAAARNLRLQQKYLPTVSFQNRARPLRIAARRCQDAIQNAHQRLGWNLADNLLVKRPPHVGPAASASQPVIMSLSTAKR